MQEYIGRLLSPREGTDNDRSENSIPWLEDEPVLERESPDYNPRHDYTAWRNSNLRKQDDDEDEFHRLLRGGR